jgi:hypothetical protein
VANILVLVLVPVLVLVLVLVVLCYSSLIGALEKRLSENVRRGWSEVGSRSNSFWGLYERDMRCSWIALEHRAENRNL